jgi:hypothetical protein
MFSLVLYTGRAGSLLMHNDLPLLVPKPLHDFLLESFPSFAPHSLQPLVKSPSGPALAVFSASQFIFRGIGGHNRVRPPSIPTSAGVVRLSEVPLLSLAALHTG